MTFRYVPSGRVQPMGKVRSFIKRVPEQSVSNSTGRYYPGQELYGISFSYKSKNISSYRSPMLWDDDYPSDIHIIKLTVKEHHKVPNQYDEEPEPIKDCDGYLLIDTRDRVFTNQYPHASYGQISDTGNRLFTEDVKSDFDERFKNDCVDPIQYILITDAYANICKGIRDINKYLNEKYRESVLFQGLRYDDLYKKHTNLERLRKEIEDKFMAVSNGKVIYAKDMFGGAFMKGCITDTIEEAWADMYVPVMSNHELVEAVKKVKRYRVDPRKRVLPGFYKRIYTNLYTGNICIESYLLGGYVSFEKYRSRHGKPIHTPSLIPARYRSIYSVYKRLPKITLKNSTGCYISDMAYSGILLANSTDVQNLRLLFAKHHVTGFELGVLFKGWPDTKERFIKYMEDKAFFNYIDKPY